MRLKQNNNNKNKQQQTLKEAANFDRCP